MFGLHKVDFDSIKVPDWRLQLQFDLMKKGHKTIDRLLHACGYEDIDTYAEDGITYMEGHIHAAGVTHEVIRVYFNDKNRSNKVEMWMAA